jgi:hypothetical protein
MYEKPSRDQQEALPERRTSGTRGIAPCRSRLGYTLERLHIYVAHTLASAAKPAASHGLKVRMLPRL